MLLEKITVLLFLSGDPISFVKITELLNVTKEQIIELLPLLQTKLDELGLGLLQNNEELCIITKSEHGELVESYRKEELKGDLTPATLQVLTLIAYIGSPTREDISYIRGVQSAQSIRSLTVRGLIARSGETCSLTTNALQQLGVTTITELPEYDRIHDEFIQKLSSREV
ncbi:MAG: segregation and condensation protein segregation and condensation protein [Candidatus Parcubacteria bacterium]|jgi:segregation and condensation protein B